MAHSACWTDRGGVFTWGGGWFGRLGLGGTDNEYAPQRVPALQYRVVKQVGAPAGSRSSARRGDGAARPRLG